MLIEAPKRGETVAAQKPDAALLPSASISRYGVAPTVLGNQRSVISKRSSALAILPKQL
jgi:hypothetical protein